MNAKLYNFAGLALMIAAGVSAQAGVAAELITPPLASATAGDVVGQNVLTDGVIYQEKCVRFTVVADGLIRMEYAPDGKFVNDKSFVAVNRKYPVGAHAEVTEKDGMVVITTPKMTLRYRKNSGKFTLANLSIESGAGMKSFVWHPGDKQNANLLGTTRTLDRWNGFDIIEKGKEKEPPTKKGVVEPGILARDGWTLIDDSRNFLFDNDPELEWVKKRKSKKGAQDWYFLSYGNDYKGALKDFTRLAGDIPLPPRYAFGYWWSRWWAYSENEYRQLINNFKDYQIPLEVLVMDMDWHYTDEAHGGWTGWTWNKWLFPDPPKFLNYLRDNNLKVTLNLHPASGVKKFESAYPAIAMENGIDPRSEKTVEWVSSDKRFVNSVFKHILNPMSKDGVTFWWLDWQQQPFDAKIDSLSNTWWLNYTFFTKMAKDRPEIRPMLYHRWGGLGNHRYQIGFSGDNYHTWQSLDFLPWFTATASNVCYGFWSHDLGGHYLAPGDSITNPELYVRSMQFGAYSPIMRTHSNKKAELQKEPWVQDRTTLNAIRESIQLRYRMAPYIYTMARKSHDTGVSLCRPMYYEWPDAEESYTYKNQYMFGDNMLVRPVTAPGKDGLAEVEVWLPEGKWYDEAMGEMLDGGKVYKRSYRLNEVPVFIKVGSVMPFHAEKETTLRHNTAPISFMVIPGADGEFTYYEDNGDDQKYQEESAQTLVTSQFVGDKLTVTINPRKGNYDGMPEQRRFELQVPATKRPLGVKVDGQDAEFEYDVTKLATIVKLPLKNCDVKRVVEIQYPADYIVANGVIGEMKRFVETFGELKNHYAKLGVNEEFGPMSVIYESLNYFPERNDTLLEDFHNKYQDLGNVAKRQNMSKEARKWFNRQMGLK